MRLLRIVFLMCFVLWIATACQPVPREDTPQPATEEPVFTVKPLGEVTFPAGDSMTWELSMNSQPSEGVWFDYQVENPPPGLTTQFTQSGDHLGQDLIITTAETMTPGSYSFGVSAFREEEKKAPVLIGQGEVEFSVVECIETEPGEFRRSIKADLRSFRPGGKSSWTRALIIPIQICRSSHFQFTLKRAISEAGGEVSTVPGIYLYRSRIYPALTVGGKAATRCDDAECGYVDWPGSIMTREWEFQADVSAGLYLLVFSNNERYRDLPPESRPDWITYNLQIGP